MMNIAVRYYTRSGNTKKLADAAAKAASVSAQDISIPLAEKVDILLLGCSYYAFDVDEAVKKFIIDNKENSSPRYPQHSKPLCAPSLRG